AIPGDLSVEEGRDRYLAENGFDMEGYTARTFSLRILGVPLRLPNTRERRRVLPLHDLHHVALGYGTDFAGEGEIAAWELRAGCNTATLYFLNVSAVLLGMVASPRRVVRAFRHARGARSLYELSMPYDDLLRMSVDELRAKLGVGVGVRAEEDPRTGASSTSS